MRAALFALFVAACVGPAPSEGKAPNPRPLAGTEWILVLDESSRTAPTIEFREAGRASGFTGCNQWFAQVDRNGGGLRFDAIGMTRRACETRAMEIERSFTAYLEQTHAAQVDDGTLTLIDADGVAIAQFERAR